MRVVDRIAYINHDIDDALRAGVIAPGDLPREAIAILGSTGSERIDTLVHDVVEVARRLIITSSSLLAPLIRTSRLLRANARLGPPHTFEPGP